MKAAGSRFSYACPATPELLEAGGGLPDAGAAAGCCPGDFRARDRVPRACWDNAESIHAGDGLSETQDEVIQNPEFIVTVHLQAGSIDAVFRMLFAHNVGGIQRGGEVGQRNVSHFKIGNLLPYRLNIQRFRQHLLGSYRH